MTAPEFQAVDVLTVAGYANTMIQYIQNKGWPGNDVVTTYSAEIAALMPVNPTDPDFHQALIDRLNMLYFGGGMSANLSARLNRVMASTGATIKTPSATQRTQMRLDKVRSALILVLTSPEYLVQG